MILWKPDLNNRVIVATDHLSFLYGFFEFVFLIAPIPDRFDIFLSRDCFGVEYRVELACTIEVVDILAFKGRCCKFKPRKMLESKLLE